MAKEQTIDSRMADEKAEGEAVVDTKVPAGRFQGKQQIVKPVQQQEKSPVAENPFNPKKIESKGSQLKQEQVAKVITGTGGSAPVEGIASPTKAGLKTMSYSGNEGTILGNASGTPVVGSPSRSDTRPGQKMDAVAKAIDYIASEQSYHDVQGSVALQDNPGETQGFLGHPENISARIQKTAEVVPGALLYDRSLDENTRDELAFVEGQMIKESGVTYKVSPTKTYDRETGQYKAFTDDRSNYIPKFMHIGVNKQGKVMSFTFDVEQYGITKSSEIVNRSSSAFIRAMNIDEINRQNMEHVAGVETEKNWCPLVRAINEPTATIGFLTDDEITTSSEIFMAYRFLNKSHSYFFNKAGKDGQLPYRSFKEMLKGATVPTSDSTEYDDTVNFTYKDYCNGAPSLMIALYDSIAKYSKRGDLLVQPRSWKMHKQTADNNINMFRMHPLLAKYVTNRDVFSTIDRGYDGMLPTCISDAWRLIHVKDFSKLCRVNYATTFILKLGGKGLSTAGDNFNDVYDNLNGSTPSDSATLKLKNSSNNYVNDVYTELGYTKSVNYGNPILKIVGNKTGFDTYDDGLAAAIELLDGIKHQGNNAQLKPIVIMFKEKVTGGVDRVYAVIRYPGIFDADTVADTKLFIKHSTTDDYLSSDTSVDAVVYRQDEQLDVDHLTYKYQNRQNPYIVEVRNPLLYGIKEWADNLGTKLARPSTSDTFNFDSEADGQGLLWYHIPITHNTTHISLWDLIICAAVPFMQKIRTNSQFDTLNYEDANGKYPYEQLDTIANLNPLASSNFGFEDILKPLKVGQMKPAVALSWIKPEKFWRIAHGIADSKKGAKTAGDLVSETFVFPWYFSEYALDKVNSDSVVTTAKMKVEGHLMNYPSTRAGARLAYLDDYYGMKERDVRLCLDMMVDIPGVDATTNPPEYCGAYKYGLSNSGVPVIKYTNANQALDIRAYLSTPRELGLGMVAPLGYNSYALNQKYATNRVDQWKNFAEPTDLISLGTSYRVRAWKVHDGKYKTAFDPTELVVTRGGNFAQDWTMRADAIYAAADNTSIKESRIAINAAKNIGVAVNFNDTMEVANGAITGEGNESLFKPYVFADNAQNNNLPNILTLQKSLWAKVQLFPYALSPFDQTPECRDVSGTPTVFDMTSDPYDLMYIFGFIGYKASDFREDAYNRLYEKLNLGWLYTKDPFIEASPVLN